ncbi:MAG TPA: RsmG family class I SAM-dependent methyltransferase, partial [Pyrinomonadaceae bacterium]|nr:RsmG family class I SAM-dependent methyltransferase [Pyrinomonadaceae bacterium]
MWERGGVAGEEFEAALAARAGAFGLTLDEAARERLRSYFEILTAWNARLHLVAPCAPEEFAVRHVLESLLALPFLAEGARVLDVGSGGGLPAIPCLAVREDLSAVLFESSAKKAVFLREALRRVGASGRARVSAERFETAEAPGADAVTCRALERFAETIPRLVAWSPPGATLLFFGGDKIR